MILIYKNLLHISFFMFALMAYPRGRTIPPRPLCNREGPAPMPLLGRGALPRHPALLTLSADHIEAVAEAFRCALGDGPSNRCRGVSRAVKPPKGDCLQQNPAHVDCSLLEIKCSFEDSLFPKKTSKDLLGLFCDPTELEHPPTKPMRRCMNSFPPLEEFVCPTKHRWQSLFGLPVARGFV